MFGRLLDAVDPKLVDQAERALGEAPGQLLDWYQAKVEGAGFSAERQTRDGDQILAGTGPSGGAYYLIVTPRARGADVALITNNGI